jgi:hypothetical protein
MFGATPLYRALGTTNTTSQRLAVGRAHAGVLVAQAALARARSVHGVGAAAGLAEANSAVSEARYQLAGAEKTLRRAETAPTGLDVEVLADNLAALGYYHGSGPVWSQPLQAAVSAWQHHIGMSATGRVSPSDVVILRGPSRVAAVNGRLGAPASSVGISLSATFALAVFHLHKAVPHSLTRRRQVLVSTAAGKSATGTVSRVTASGSTTTVVVTLPRGSSLADSNTTKVTMTVTISARRNVLVVPIQALLALASGGSAVQLPDGRLVPVKITASHGDDVAISGVGVRPGLRVVSVS